MAERTPARPGGLFGWAGAARARRWAGRLKASPSRLEALFADLDAVAGARQRADGRLDEVEARLTGIEGATRSLSDDGRAGVTAVGAEIHRLRADLEASIDALDRSLAGHAQTLQRVAASPVRGAESTRLLAALGPPRPTKAGLSVLTICWNHGGLLPGAVTAGLAVLDALPMEQQGEMLILDDGSVDETAAVAAGLAAADPRVRVVSARTNLGLARARNALLHTVGTRYAFVLDADNTATAAGVQALLAVAEEHGAAFTYGNVLKRDADGNPAGAMSNEPLTEPWFRSNYIDTMAVVDVDRLRALGGWLEDPTVEHLDDWALVHRLARAGELIGFVPVVVGRYTQLRHAFRLSVPDVRLGPDRVRRIFNPDGFLTVEHIAAFAAHPQLGPLWATPAAVARRPELAPPLRDRGAVPDAPRLLVIGPGGVANLGDDAIVAAGLAQLRRLVPGHDIDVVTDGPAPTGLGPRALWSGPLTEAVRGLRDDDLAPDRPHWLVDAASRCGVGSQTYRPLEPASYAGAVFLGGGSLTSRWGDTLVAPRAVLAAALDRAGIGYVVSGQGIGSLEDGDAALVGSLLGGARRCAVRDARSGAIQSALTSGHEGAPPVEVTGDDALLLESARAAPVTAALARAGVDGPYLAITVREAEYVGTGVEEIERWARAIDRLAAARGLTVLGVGLNEHAAHPEILSLARIATSESPRRSRWRVLECHDDPALLAGVMAGADAAVVHSYHAALFALRAAVPTLLVASSPYYEHKAVGLADQAGLPDAFLLRPSPSNDLSAQLDLVTKALATGPGLQPAIRAVQDWWNAAISELIR